MEKTGFCSFLTVTCFILVHCAESCPEDWVDFNESCYKGFTDNEHEVSMVDASGACQGLSAELPVIQDEATNTFIFGLLPQAGYTWLGLNDIEQEGVYKWVDGSAITYNHWFEEPVNADFIDCAILSDDSYWYTAFCGSSFHFVCVKPKESTSDPTTTYIPTTTSDPTTTYIPTTTSDPTTTSFPTTISDPTTTYIPTTTSDPTTTYIPTTTSDPTTTSIPTTTSDPTTTFFPTTTSDPTTTYIPTTTSDPTTTYIPTTTTDPTTTFFPTTTSDPTTTFIPTTTSSTTPIITSTSSSSTTTTTITTTSSSTSSEKCSWELACNTNARRKRSVTTGGLRKIRRNGGIYLVPEQ